MPTDTVPALVKSITRAAKAYYRGEDSGLTDEQFDDLRDRLKALDPAHPLLASVGHGFSGGNTLKKVKLTTRMGSLDNCFSRDDIRRWVERVTKLCNDQGIPVPKRVAFQPKLDGLSVQLTYRNGMLVQAATRGDGAVGEDVTASARKAHGVPLSIPETGDLDVRGEMVVLKADFEKYFKPEGAANARNSAAGTVRRQDGRLAEHLWFIAFDANFLDGREDDRFKTELIMNTTLNLWRFTAAFTSDTPFEVDAIVAEWEAWKARRDNLNYLADGCVVKVNGRRTAKALGWSESCPRGAFAGKWKGGMVAVTEVLGVEHSVGRTGVITPVAKVKPVECGGVTVESVSLMNWDEVNRIEDGSLGKATLGVGSTVRIERAGDVIPRVIAVIKACKPQDVFGRPEKCPSCGTQTIVDGPRQRCPNGGGCPAQGYRWVLNWVKKREIMFLGDETIDRLMAIGGPVSKPSDLYALSRDELKAATGGYVMADKIAAQLEKSRDCTLAQLFGAVGIEGCGMVEAEKAVAHLAAEDVETVITRVDELEPALGPARAGLFAAGVRGMETEIRALAAVLRIAKPVAVDTSKATAAWKGKTFCITGATELPRNALIDIIVKAGGVWKSSVSKNCEYLVIADPSSTSNKAEAARKLGVTLISEAQALDMADYS